MKNHIALAIALALGSTLAIAGDKHKSEKSDSTAAPASEQSATQDQAQPKSGEAMKEGAAGSAGPESLPGEKGAAGANAQPGASGEITTDKPKK